MKPNHICKYSKCNLGDDGGKKKYYACDYCDRINSWHSAACCKEHYDLYVKEVLNARGKNLEINPLPQRLDKTPEEVKELYDKPISEVLTETKEELKEYITDEEINIEEVVEKINNDISRKKTKRKVGVK